MRYDVAIIGAGADGLAAAARLARAGLRTVVIGRTVACGGALATRAFHPGFRASPFQDSVAEIPPILLETLDGVTLRAAAPLPEEIRARHDAALTHLFADAATPRSHGLLARVLRANAPSAPVWPGSDLATACLADWPGLTPLVRAIDPELPGSALALLALPRAEPMTGGLGALGDAFLRAAVAAGAEFRLGLEAGEVTLAANRFGFKRVSGVLLADGSPLEASAVISTLDLKHSLLSLFRWNMLPPACLAQARAFRMAGSTARLLLALKMPPAQGRLVLAGEPGARAAWRRGAICEAPPLLFDCVSARDASLAPAGAAVATVTLGCIPCRLFDGGWTHARRLALAAHALRRIEAQLPGTIAALAAVEIIVPPDMEEALGLTDGDLDGGLLAPDQMLGLRPQLRTAVPGFYLGGPSSAAGPLGTGVAGLAAATALLADLAGHTP